MDIRKLILQTLRKEGSVKTAAIVRITGFSRAYVNRFFQQLKDEGKIIMLGKSNSAHYVLGTEQAVSSARKKIAKTHRILHNESLHEDVVLNDIKKTTGIFMELPECTSTILHYAFTEMLNNAIEHSQSETIEITMEKDKEGISFCVIDKGVGIYNNIMKKKHLNDKMQAIQDLTKGKLSTAPKAHSGEGIFFTSKAADMLIIQSSQKSLVFNNLLHDVFINDIKNIIGTKVSFFININSKKNLEDIFRQYTDESFKFSKTKVVIKLYRDGSEYISRSQARRILSGLDKFETIILDFKDIETVGQGFADEVFRVWKPRYPEINIVHRNANENVQFMIDRAIAQA